MNPALKQSAHLLGEEQLRLITDALPVLVSYIDTQDRYRFNNREYEEGTGRSRAGLIGKTVREVMGDEAHDLLAPHICRVIKGERLSFESTLTHNRLGKRTIEVDYIPDLSETGEVRGFVVLASDITESKKAHELLEKRVAMRTAELSQSRSFLDLLVQHIPNMIFVKDARDLKFIRLNKAGEDLLGVSQKDLLGKSDYDIFPKDQAEFFTSKDRDVLKQGTLVDIPQEPIDTPHGQRILHTRKIPLLNKAGEPEYLLGISEDITEKIQAELNLKKSQEELMASHIELERRVLERTQELESANTRLADAVQARDEFLSIASHELKTPLTPLKLQLQSFLRQLDSDKITQARIEQAQRLAASSNRQINRITRLVDDLLDVSRISAGQLNLNREEVDLRDLVAEAIERYTPQIQKAECQVEIFAPEPVTGHYDRLRMEQVVINLITNALKYAPGRPIFISVEEFKTDETPCARLLVRDEGIGIAPENLSRIFNRFERAGTSCNVGGLGLGLYITRQIVEAHGGTIHAQSDWGKGATFVVELPMRTETQTQRLKFASN